MLPTVSFIGPGDTTVKNLQVGRRMSGVVASSRRDTASNVVDVRYTSVPAERHYSCTWHRKILSISGEHRLHRDHAYNDIHSLHCCTGRARLA